MSSSLLYRNGRVFEMLKKRLIVQYLAVHEEHVKGISVRIMGGAGMQAEPCLFLGFIWTGTISITSGGFSGFAGRFEFYERQSTGNTEAWFIAHFDKWAASQGSPREWRVPDAEDFTGIILRKDRSHLVRDADASIFQVYHGMLVQYASDYRKQLEAVVRIEPSLRAKYDAFRVLHMRFSAFVAGVHTENATRYVQSQD